MEIDKRAIVSPDAEIADDVIIGPYSIIESDVKIGSGTRIESCAVIASGSRIGKNCRIFHSAVIGTIPQDLKFEGEYTTVQIGDGTIIREFCTINRGSKVLNTTIVGSNCLIMAYAHIAHDCVIGNNVIIANAVNMGGHVSIDDFASVGGVVAIHQFVRIGKHSFVGGGFRAIQDVPPYILAAGYPLNFEGLNVVGLRRKKIGRETLSILKNAYKIIYQSGLNTSQALEKIKNIEKQTPELKYIYDFISNSIRGII